MILLDPPVMNTKDRHVRHLNILSKIACDVNTSFVGNARLAACVVIGNSVVSFGTNEMKTHPFQAKFSKNNSAVYLHAETSAIKNSLKYLKISDLEKATLYVCRVKFQDEQKSSIVFGMARPCNGCLRCITTFGIRRVVFTLDNGEYSML